jgi:hypothetical protein
MIEVICSSETSVEFQRTTQRYIPEDRTLYNGWCENLNLTKAVRSSETSVSVYRTTRRHTPEDSTLDIYYCENLSSVYTHVFIPRRSFHTGKLARDVSRELASQKLKSTPVVLGVQWDVRIAGSRPERKTWSCLMEDESLLVLDDSQLLLLAPPSRKCDAPWCINSTNGTVIFSPCLTENQTMNTYGGIQLQLHRFMYSVTDGGEWPALRSGRLNSGETISGTIG